MLRVWLITLLLCVVMCNHTYSQAQQYNVAAPTLRDITAWWKATQGFTGGPLWYDLIGRYHGTLVNMSTSGWSAPTRPNSLGEIRFDGTTSYVNSGNIVELNSTPAFTLTAWLKQTTIDVQAGIFTKALNGTTYLDVITWNDGLMLVEISNAGAYSVGNFDYSTAVTAQKWFHLAVVYNGKGSSNAERLKLYIDGKAITLSFSGTIPATLDNLSTSNAWIGRYDSGGAKIWAGAMDDIRFYNRALNVPEIQAVFTEGLILPIITPLGFIQQVVSSFSTFFRFFPPQRDKRGMVW